MESSGFAVIVVLLLVASLPRHVCGDDIKCIWDTSVWTSPSCSEEVTSDDHTMKVPANTTIVFYQGLPPVMKDGVIIYGAIIMVPSDQAENLICPDDPSNPQNKQYSYSYFNSTEDEWRGLNMSVVLPVNRSFGLISMDPLSCGRGAKINVQILSEPVELSKSQVTKNRDNKLVLILGIVGGVLVVIGILVALAIRRRTWHRLNPTNSKNSRGSDFSSVTDLSDLEVGGPHQYSYKELSAATNSFNSKFVVGEGGFGTVYKGTLRETGSSVAIKRLSQYARNGAREFLAEVKIISQLRHRNLVPLLGWCFDKDELILVYEYMPNGDLDELIYSDKPKCKLSWKQRYNTLCGVASALVYLHEEWEQRVVHRDVKTSNVMLDGNLNARLGDFGLARLSAHSQAPQSTLVAGTLGYLAPEFSLSGKATDKTDVYAFGVVSLEVTCARRPLSPDCILVDWVWDLHKSDKILEAADPKLDLLSTDDEVQMKTVLQVGLLCAHPDVNARPSMRQVLNILTGQASMPRVPRSKPVASYFEEMD